MLSAFFLEEKKLPHSFRGGEKGSLGRGLSLIKGGAGQRRDSTSLFRRDNPLLSLQNGPNLSLLFVAHRKVSEPGGMGKGARSWAEGGGGKIHLPPASLKRGSVPQKIRAFSLRGEKKKKWFLFSDEVKSPRASTGLVNSEIFFLSLFGDTSSYLRKGENSWSFPQSPSLVPPSGRERKGSFSYFSLRAERSKQEGRRCWRYPQHT